MNEFDFLNSILEFSITNPIGIILLILVVTLFILVLISNIIKNENFLPTLKFIRKGVDRNRKLTEYLNNASNTTEIITDINNNINEIRHLYVECGNLKEAYIKMNIHFFLRKIYILILEMLLHYNDLFLESDGQVKVLKCWDTISNSIKDNLMLSANSEIEMLGDASLSQNFQNYTETTLISNIKREYSRFIKDFLDSNTSDEKKELTMNLRLVIAGFYNDIYLYMKDPNVAYSKKVTNNEYRNN